MARYSKFLVAALTAALAALAAALTDNTVTSQEAVGVALAVLTALGVYVVPNRP